MKMGFSTALQGLQEAELRLMEIVKRTIQMKAKCDKDYATGLATVALHGLKMDRADDLHGSVIAKSWRSYMDELDQQAKQIKLNAESLDNVCEKIARLSQDKRRARKAYQEEYTKISERLTHLTEEVLRKKSEYQKYLEGYKTLRTRFEEHYIKSGRGGRKLDDVRDKYQKACRKLHLTHNEYVLSITEAIEVEKDFRTVLLPGLLEHQQSVQESFILLWRNILSEAVQYSDLTADKFKEIQRRIDNVINNINPTEEYRELTEKHKTSPATQRKFQFDENLIEDIPGKLQSNTLTVDNLTVDWLRTRLLELELAVKECQDKQLKMIEHVNGGSPKANGTLIISNCTPTTTTNGIQSTKESQSRNSKELNLVRCQERQKQKLLDMIKCALNEVGCEELPSGCDDHLSLEQNFIENGFNQDQQTSNASTSSMSMSMMTGLIRRGGVLTLWPGRYFKRKSTPQPTTPTTRTRGQRFAHKLKPRSQSLGSLSVNTRSPAKYEPITNPLRMAVSHSHELHDMLDIDSVIMFGRSRGRSGCGANNPILPKLKRTQFSLQCLNEEARISEENIHAAVALIANDILRRPLPSPNAIENKNQDEKTPDSITNKHSSNNNNIYADLELIDGRLVEQTGHDGSVDANNDCESSNSSEITVRQIENVEIEINRVDSGCEDSAITVTKTDILESDITDSTVLNASNGSEETNKLSMDPLENSIDAHLDKIDEINRALDDRLKRNLPLRGIQAKVDFDAIEPAALGETASVQKRNKVLDDIETLAKRLSSSSSDSSSKQRDGQWQENGHHKKRSLSFSQKSINALISNIKEFSRSPLARMHKSQTHDLKLVEELNENAVNNNETLQQQQETAAGMATTTSNEIDETLQDLANNNPVNNEPLMAGVDASPSAAQASSPPPLPASNAETQQTSGAALPSSSSTPSSSLMSSKLAKLKVSKLNKKSKDIRQTFRTKFVNFQMKRKTKLCKTCTKRRRIHPSKSVLDFAKEFNLPTNQINSQDGDEFCSCPEESSIKYKQPQSRKFKKYGKSKFKSMATHNENDNDHGFGDENLNFGDEDFDDDDDDDDVLSIKDHCYCVPSLATNMSLSTNRPLYEEEWFHGVLPREEVVRLLNNDGDFLVRETIRNEESQIVLSVCWNGHKHFIVQTTSDGHFRFEGPPFPSIQELIMHQYQSTLPVTTKSGAILKRPVCRERWELSNDDVVLLEKIGRGNFGDVYKAKLKSTKQDVAVKTCRMTLPEEQKRKFLQEGRILKQYDHPNIVKLIGICVQKQPIMIVMELVPGGSLLNYLRKNSNALTTLQQMGMCRDAAGGMQYLESKNCIHRDLAARNCLVDFENRVKISDFGMSREEEEYIVSDGMKQIPVKWTAPEALNFGKYTSLCDVWSYGILMWEIFSKGDTPYSGMSNSRAREHIDAGYRMPAPDQTPPEMYRLMSKCWAAEPEARPHFEEICNIIDALIMRLENSH